MSIAILQGSHEEGLNVRSVFYHMVADAASSVGIVAAAVVIFFTAWNTLDPLVSMGISAVIIHWSWRILRDSTKVLLEIAPTRLNMDIIADDLKTRFPQIKDLYNAHLWMITAGMIVYSAHVELEDVPNPADAESLVARINSHLSEWYGIIESMIQVASSDEAGVCEIS